MKLRTRWPIKYVRGILCIPYASTWSNRIENIFEVYNEEIITLTKFPVDRPQKTQILIIWTVLGVSLWYKIPFVKISLLNRTEVTDIYWHDWILWNGNGLLTWLVPPIINGVKLFFSWDHRKTRQAETINLLDGWHKRNARTAQTGFI